MLTAPAAAVERPPETSTAVAFQPPTVETSGLTLTLSLSLNRLRAMLSNEVESRFGWDFRLAVLEGGHRVTVYDDRNRLVVAETVAPVQDVPTSVADELPRLYEWVTGLAGCRFTSRVALGPSRLRAVAATLRGPISGHHPAVILPVPGSPDAFSALAIRRDGTGWTSWHSRTGDDPYVVSTSTTLQPVRPPAARQE